MASKTSFLFVGDHLAFDFVNTELRQQGQPHDLLGSFDDLLDWAQQAGYLDGDVAVQSRRWCGTPRGTEALARARQFRSELRSMAECMLKRRRVSQEVLASLNRLLQRPVEYTQVARSGRGFVRRTLFSPSEPGDVLVPVARAAAELLTSGDWTRVHACGNPQCVILFYDRTRSHTRRWCSMAVCGNRMKAAAFFQRHGKTRAPEVQT